MRLLVQSERGCQHISQVLIVAAYPVEKRLLTDDLKLQSKTTAKMKSGGRAPCFCRFYISVMC